MGQVSSEYPGPWERERRRVEGLCLKCGIPPDAKRHNGQGRIDFRHPFERVPNVAPKREGL